VIHVGIVIEDDDFRASMVACLQSFAAGVAFAVADASREIEKLEYTNPDVLILDFGRPSAHAVMAELRSMLNPPAVIGASLAADPEIIVSALRAGVREFLYPPLKTETVKAALDAIASERMQADARRQATKSLGFVSARGGCGATTLACHIAAELRRMELGNVLVADFDLAAGTAGFWLRANGGYSILDAVNSLSRMDQSLWMGMVSTVQPHLDVLAAPAEIPLAGLPGNRGFEEILRIARSQYDWVIADLGRGLCALNVALMSELSAIFLVTTPEVEALLQSRRIIDRLTNLGHPKEFIRVAVNRVFADQDLSASELGKMIGLPVEAILPDDRREVAEAHSSGRLISPRAELGKRIAQLAASIAGQNPVEKRASRFSLFRSVRTQPA